MKFTFDLPPGLECKENLTTESWVKFGPGNSIHGVSEDTIDKKLDIIIQNFYLQTFFLILQWCKQLIYSYIFHNF